MADQCLQHSFKFVITITITNIIIIIIIIIVLIHMIMSHSIVKNYTASWATVYSSGFYLRVITTVVVVAVEGITRTDQILTSVHAYLINIITPPLHCPVSYGS